MTLWCAAASAQVIIGNYPPLNDDGVVNIDDGLAIAVGFTMPAGSPIDLPPVRVRLEVQSPVTSFSADLFGDSGGAPTNPVLVSFADPLSFPIAGCRDYFLAPTSAFALQPSTTYWLRLRGDAPFGGGDVGWCESNPDTPYSGIATSAGAFQNFADPPTSNLASPPGNPTYAVGLGISVVEIPTLGRWGLMALAALLAGAAVRVRRRPARCR